MKTTLDLLKEGLISFPLEYEGKPILLRNGDAIIPQYIADILSSEARVFSFDKSFHHVAMDVKIPHEEDEFDIIGHLVVDYNKTNDCLSVILEGQKLLEKCPDCNGTGYMDCPTCGQETDCDVCDGYGEIFHEGDYLQIPTEPLVLKTIPLNQGELF